MVEQTNFERQQLTFPFTVLYTNARVICFNAGGRLCTLQEVMEGNY